VHPFFQLFPIRSVGGFCIGEPFLDLSAEEMSDIGSSGLTGSGRRRFRRPKTGIGHESHLQVKLG
jgi:hypothetical protein